MKKFLMTLLVALLVAALAVGLAACGGDGGGKETPAGPTADVSVYKSGKGYETINDPLSWEALNKFPVVHDGMTIEEGKDLVVDFFRYCKTAVWMPSDNYEYKIKSANTTTEMVTGYVPYGGLPYISVASGNIYRLMDYMDPETHVVDIATAGAKSTLFGNQCSFGSYVGIGRVINSAKYSWTKNMTVSAGFVKVGDYEYDETVTEYKQGFYNTEDILSRNGSEKMYECYAGLKKGDVIVYFTSAGHVVMISEDAHVEYNDDDTINGANSYVYVIDQTPGHAQMTNEAGDTFNYEKNVDAKWTFDKLWQGNYVPFTFKEWLGEDPIESSKTEISHSGDSISMEQLYETKVTSNYGITDIYASVYHPNGKEVYKIAVRSTTTSVMEQEFAKPGVYHVDEWGKLEDLDASTAYTVKIYAQLSTGERPVLWEGKLAQ